MSSIVGTISFINFDIHGETEAFDGIWPPLDGKSSMFQKGPGPFQYGTDIAFGERSGGGFVWRTSIMMDFKT